MPRSPGTGTQEGGGVRRRTPARHGRDAAGFPIGGGELGTLIRTFDWSKTGLGPIESWPQSLKTATDIVLQSPLPLVMLWGRDGIMIYNDPYSVFAGARHPRLLGSKVLEGWAEVADFNARVMAVGLAGGTLSFKNQELTLYRNDVAEQVWMDLNYGPVLDESGQPAGVLAIVVETTGPVLAERRQELLFQLGESLRDLLDPTAIVREAATIFGTHLNADRAGWTEIDERAETSRVRADWTSAGMPSMTGEHRLAIYSRARLAALRDGRTVRTDDVQSDPLISEDVKASYAARHVAAGLTVPIVENRQLKAAFFVHSRTPRHWTEEEEALVRDVAARTWTALKRAHAEARLRSSEEHLRLVVNELNHRVKNNLAVTQAIAAQTFRNSDNLRQAEASFSDRIMALARANDLVTQEGWSGLTLQDVIDSVLRPHCGPEAGRYIIAGPALHLSAKTLLSLSMGFHELATNAMKYGAWSRPGGRVQVTWSIEGEHDMRLKLEWRESGGPPVVLPRRRGFGSRLIERGLPAELEGEVTLHFEPTGVVCKIDAPLFAAQEPEA